MLDEKNAIVLIATPPYGGAEKRYLRLYEHLQLYFNNLYLIINKNVNQEIGVADNYKNDRIIIVDKGLNFPGKSRLLKFIKYFLWPLLIVRQAQFFKVRHLHYTVNPGYISALLTLLSGLFNISLSVSVVDSTKTLSSDFNCFERLCWKYTLKKVNLIDALSPSIKNNLSNIFGARVCSKTRVSPCSFSIYGTKEYLDNDRDIDLVFASRFVEGKGLQLLLEALKILDRKHHHKSLNVHICGKGPLEDLIHKSVQQLTQTNVSVYWANNMAELFARAKILVSLQQVENYPSQAVLEAADHAVAVIATNVGDTRLFISDSDAILINNSAQEVADAIELLLSNSKLREELGYNLRDYILKNHTLERYTEYFIAFLEEANQAGIKITQKGDTN